MGPGVALIVAGSLLALAATAGLRRGRARVASLGVLAACGLLVGAGALLLQDAASPGEWTLTLVVLGLLTPLHAWLLFRRPGGTG